MSENADHTESPRTDAPAVHLGYVEPIQDEEHLQQVAFRCPDYNLWDGGQLGGSPSWLDPQHVPQGPLGCSHCPRNEKGGDDHPIMSFVCQIYAPVDEYESRAFHRALYVFACRSCNSVRILRAQLPQQNPYFPAQPGDNDLKDWKNHVSSQYKVHLCQVCGCRAAYQCPLQKQHFCCRAHQKEYFHHVHHPLQHQQQQQQPHQQNNLQLIQLPSLYPIAEIVVEAEQASSGDDDAENAALLQKQEDTLFATNSDDEHDSDQDLEQDDLNRMVQGGASSNKKKNAAGVTDPTTLAFLETCQRNPEQILRYQRWTPHETASSSNANDNALWFRQDQQPPEIPPCSYCGAPRRFEFQLMPQILNHLAQPSKPEKDDPTTNTEQDEWQKVMQAMQQVDSLMEHLPPEHVPPRLVDAKQDATKRYQQTKLHNTFANELDFGVVAVYTCTNSCGTGSGEDETETEHEERSAQLGSYREEYAWVQTSL